MNKVLSALVLVFTVSLLPLAQAADTPNCDSLDKRSDSRKLDINSSLRARNGELSFKEEGKVVMLITRSGDLHLDGDRVELTPRGRVLVTAYYENVDKALDEFASLGMDAAQLGISAAGTAIFRLLTGQLDEKEFEREVESRARKIAERADLACTYLQDIEHIEVEMVEEIPGFRPMMFADRHSI